MQRTCYDQESILTCSSQHINDGFRPYGLESPLPWQRSSRLEPRHVTCGGENGRAELWSQRLLAQGPFLAVWPILYGPHGKLQRPLLPLSASTTLCRLHLFFPSLYLAPADLPASSERTANSSIASRTLSPNPTSRKRVVLLADVPRPFRARRLDFGHKNPTCFQETDQT